jgi:homoserine dehydrogenase
VSELRIGLIGAGTVGRGLIQLLAERGDALEQRTGIAFNLIAVADRSAEKKPFLKDQSFDVTDNPLGLIERSDVDVVVELIGGLEPARELLLAAIRSGKHVVTANKALLANNGPEVFRLAASTGVSVGFEAAVAGALPVIRTLRRQWIGSDFNELFGILNGTCNFIITKMQKDGMSYRDALTIAQEKGFAEADPSFDVSGRDAAQKLAILSTLAFDRCVLEEHIRVEGIADLSPLDHTMALRMGRVIRLLAVARKIGQGFQLRVHPALISRDHILASVEDENNALFTDDPYSGPTMIVGRGAGGLPTASAVLGDLAAIGRNAGALPEVWFSGEESPVTVDDSEYRFYLRFTTVDRAGVLARLSRILADREISIATMHQEEGTEPVDVVMVTHVARESNLFSALEEIDSLDLIRAPTVALRLEEPGSGQA